LSTVITPLYFKGGITIQDLFFSGMSYDEYVTKMGEDHRTGFAKSYTEASISPHDLALLKRLAGPIYALAVSEPRCGDCRLNLPVLAKLAALSEGKLVLRCLDKGAHPTLLDDYRAADGSVRIPTFIFFSSDWRLLGYFVERPAQVSHILATGSAEEVRELRIQYNGGRFAQAVIAEIMAILSR